MTTEFKPWMRVCSITGEGMDSGWVTEDATTYFKYEKDALEWCKKQGYETIEDAYKDDLIYYTDWEDEAPIAVEYNGKMYHE